MSLDRAGAVACAALTAPIAPWHAFASHLDGVRVPELVRREAPADTCCDRGSYTNPLGQRYSNTADRASDR